MEALTNDLMTESLQPKTGVGVKLSKNTERIPGLLFADDCLLFCRADMESCWRLKHILDAFCMSSGQLINYHKSTLTFSKNANSSHRQVVAGIFSITHTDSLGKYLGCPVFQKKPNRLIFQELIERTMTKLNGWKANCLSKAGRIVLIQSHIESLPAHTMQCFQLPISITTQIDRLSREFFWKKNNTEKGLPLVAWDRICRPKDKGGIGLRKSAAINVAFQCKLAWKILKNNDSMWVRIMRDKYILSQDFFNYKSRQGDSNVWKSIVKCKDLIRQGIVWLVGDGRMISFWFDNWIENKSLCELLNMDKDEITNPDMNVCEFIQDQQWNVSKLAQYIGRGDIIQKIIGIPLSITAINDSYCWGLSSSGNFTTKTATWLAHDHPVIEEPVWRFKWIWKIDTMPKIKFFLWQMCLNALPVRGTLFRRLGRVEP